MDAVIGGEQRAAFYLSAAGCLGEEQKRFIKQSFASASKPQPVGEPLDWLTNQWPEKWKLDGQIKTFDWD